MIEEFKCWEVWELIPEEIKKSIGMELLEDDRYIARVKIGNNGKFEGLEIGYREDNWVLKCTS